MSSQNDSRHARHALLFGELGPCDGVFSVRVKENMNMFDIVISKL